MAAISQIRWLVSQMGSLVDPGALKMEKIYVAGERLGQTK
jgi:hypothetical protein